jgi:dolichol-phosphate mannosyltransferase
MKKSLRAVFSRTFVKFAIVGATGTLSNLVVYFVLADILKISYLAASVASFCVAVTQNYFFNNAWTFAYAKAEGQKSAFSANRYFLFVASSLVGLGANLLIVVALNSCYRFPLKTIPQACGILGGLLFNYLLSKRVVFRLRHKGAITDVKQK